MPSKALLAAGAVIALGLAGVALAQAPVAGAPYVTAAVADPGRPPADVQRDPERKPAEMLAFAEVRPGEKIGELLPGGGYFTRIFAKAVGPTGRVYAILPQLPAGAPAPPPSPVAAMAAEPGYANVRPVTENFTRLELPEKLDLVWTSQNYHDLHLARFKTDVAAVNKAVYDALKPGGLYVVLDHAAAPGTGLEVPDQLHRINPEIVRREVEAAGFQFVGESDVLRNPADDHLKKVFDPAIRGRTDQFIYKFRKPA